MSLTIYFNGRYLKVTPAAFDRLLPGEIEGQGAFETMRMYDSRIFALEEHMRRLSSGLRHFKMGLPVSRPKIIQVISRLSSLNKLKNSRVRVIIWRAQEKRNISISLQPLSLPSTAKYLKGYHVMTVAVRRNPTRHSHVKSVDYKMLRQISKEAQRKGFDEALLLNQKGEIVEGTRTNIFYVKEGVIFTPALRCGALNGITRRKVIACAGFLKIPVRLVRARLSELFGADEVFLTGSTLEIMPIARINGKKLKNKRSMVRLLQRSYQEMVKREVSNCPPLRQLV